ncbi:hypothetical protein FDP41_002144 [Naegleria fowleri]|uniref:Uncharacterized protein n=1 Tax=Naegleria fowleri TaxID=5763 RepID=A0A6A5BXM5_NAEFO|nr:uncharacterized protein FDP41_002144 [Naegleria fowleri]KAF0979074.1 hypothetical protein FDP41_002144 [Naegleria fowleri]
MMTSHKNDDDDANAFAQHLQSKLFCPIHFLILSFFEAIYSDRECIKTNKDFPESTSNLGENILYGIGCTTAFFLSPKDQSKNTLQVFLNMLFELRHHDNNYCLFNRMLYNAISYDKYGRFGIEIKTSLSPTIVTRMRKLLFSH